MLSRRTIRRRHWLPLEEKPIDHSTRCYVCGLPLADGNTSTNVGDDMWLCDSEDCAEEFGFEDGVICQDAET